MVDYQQQNCFDFFLCGAFGSVSVWLSLAMASLVARVEYMDGRVIFSRR